jgi:hypothetical protein
MLIPAHEGFELLAVDKNGRVVRHPVIAWSIELMGEDEVDRHSDAWYLMSSADPITPRGRVPYEAMSYPDGSIYSRGVIYESEDEWAGSRVKRRRKKGRA